MKNVILRGLTLIVILFFQNSVYSQFNSTYFKLITKGNYTDAEKKLLKDLQKEPNDVEMNFSMAILYITQKFPGNNSEKAYEYLLKAKSAFESIIKDRDIKRLNKIPINKEILDNYNDTICNHPLKEAIDINTSDIYDKYLTTYKTAPEAYLKKVTELRNETLYQIAVNKNTIDGFQDFIKNNSDAIQVPEAVIKRNQLAFEKAKRADKINDYKEFINKFSDASEVLAAYDRIHELAYIQAERENTSASYKYFIEEYPSSKQYNKAFNMMEKRQYLENTSPGDWKKYKSFIEKYPGNSWKTFAQDSIFMIGTTTENLEILNYCVDKFTAENKQKALLSLYKIFTKDGEKMSLDMFYSRYDDEIFNDVKLEDYKLAAMGDSLMRMIPQEINKPIFENFIRATAPKEKAYLVTKKLLLSDIETKNWSSALEKAKMYSTYFSGKNKRLNDLIYFLDALKNAPKPLIKEILKSEEKLMITPEIKSDILSETPLIPKNKSADSDPPVASESK